MLEDILQTTQEGDIWVGTLNIVAIVIFATIVFPPFAIAVAGGVWVIRYGFFGDLSVPSGISIDPQVQLMLILAMLGLYFLIAYLTIRETFGAQETESAKEDLINTGEEVTDTIEEKT